MTTTRETIYGAFFDLIRDDSVFVTSSRRTQIFTAISPEMQPAIYMEQVGENPVYRGRGMPYQWELDIMLGIYVYSGDENIAPSALLNPLLDVLERKLDPTVPQTLGGLVYDARLLGDGKAHAGSLGPQAFAYIPARITTF